MFKTSIRKHKRSYKNYLFNIFDLFSQENTSLSSVTIWQFVLFWKWIILNLKIRIRNQNVLEMLDPDPYVINTDPQPWFLHGQASHIVNTGELQHHVLVPNARSRSLSQIVVVDPDPHWFGSPGSGMGMRMRIQIQEQGNWPKLSNKTEFQAFQKGFCS